MSDIAPYELVIPQPVWEVAMRQLLTRPAAFAVGHCRRNQHRRARELLVDNLEVTARIPHGNNWPPLSDWTVFTIPGDGLITDASNLAQLVQPRRNQLLVVCCVGLGDNLRGWDGLVVEGERTKLLEAINIIGSRMMRVARASLADVPVEPEVAAIRWSRTRGAMGEETWQKLTETRIMLVGAGRNGSAMAYHLCALGVKQLTLIDPDDLRWENMDAMVGVTEQDVGSPKVLAIQKRLVAFRTDCVITSLHRSVTDRSPLAGRDQAN